MPVEYESEGLGKLLNHRKTWQSLLSIDCLARLTLFLQTSLMSGKGRSVDWMLTRTFWEE